MNSYSIQRQNPITDDQLHSFLRDKQRWENAIVMYQGRDPLDHWYNYLLWYTAHGHGDPENKYRETLERCLTLFEHNEFYKHDERMVRLWLKYIDMQPNPLHFYQVLYQREVGRQVADFYISWAGYYESINALKDAEAVYDLSFQQKAQPYAALHHAHSKLMFARQQQQPQASAQPHQQALHQQQPPPQHHHHHPVPPQQHEATPPPPHQPPHQQQPQHAKHISTSQQQVSYHAHAAVAYTAHEQHEDVYHQHHPHQHPHQQQHHHHHQQQQQQLEPHQQQQHLHIQQQQQHLYHQPNAYESPQQHQQQQHAVHPVDPNASAAYSHGQHPAAPIPIEQHLPPANAVGRQHQQHFAEPPHHVQQHHADAQQLPPNGQLNHQPQPQPQPEPKAKHHHQPNHHGTARLESAAATPPEDGRPSGVRLPRKFVPFSHNNTEVWRPPLYLEEPDDPSRQCHYAKTRVYPEGLSGNEYSPEELRAACYRQRAKRNAVYQEQRQMEQESQPYKEPVHVAGPPPSEHYINGQYGAYANGIAHAVEAPESGVAPAEAEESQPACEEEAEEQEEEAENETEDGAEDDDEEEADAEEDEDDDEEEGDEDDADNEATLHRQQKQQQHQQPYHRQYHQDTHGNTYGSAHHQHIDSTVRFSMQTVQHDNQSKTIKIKFKKERHVDSDATNGGGVAGGGGYTIENFGQQEAQFSPIAREANSARRSEVHHSFQPYLLGQTSTPKSSGIGGKRHKSKLKRSSHHPYSSQKPQHNHHRDHHQQHHHNNNNNNNNFQAAAFNNSNSSTAEFYGGDEVLKSNGGGGGASAATGMATAKSKKSSNSFREYNDNANYSFISAATLDNSNCSISSAVGRLNFRDITSAGGQHGLNNTTLGGAGGNSVADFSTFQENSYFATQHDYEAKERRLNKALETIERHMAKEAIDPFNSELCKAFLTKLDFPAAEDDDATANYKITQTPLPKIANTKALTLPDGVHFNIDKEVGRGSYGSVYKATDMTTGGIVALKYQKPPNIWEIYICYQVLKRIKNPNILPGYMDISTAIIAPNASLIATEFSPFGSLLDINNKIRQATTKVMHESLVMHFSSQICQIIQHLHRQHIIHADIKPDNFLLMRVPSTDLPYPSLRLIDFGCAIDMTLFPDRDDTKFRKVIQTDGFTCIEMQEGRPWSYETDLFCIAGTVHVMLLGEYMQLQKRCGAWDIKQKLPRYLKKHVWTKFFNEMLNINGGSLPDLGEMREVFDEETAKMDSELQKQIRSLSNILYKR